jgi:hypothetical protein
MCEDRRAETSESNVVALGTQQLRKEMAPQVGLEPTTLRLTAECSAIELLRSVVRARAKRALRGAARLFIIASRGGG